MSEFYKCPHCNEDICGNKKVFANHVRWCKLNPKNTNTFLDEYKTKQLDAIAKQLDNKYGVKKVFNVKCATCGKDINVEEREKQFPLKEKYYCSRSCANTRRHSSDTKLKISSGVNDYLIEHGKEAKTEHNCVICGAVITTRHRKYCSPKCKRINFIKSKECGFIFLNEIERYKEELKLYRKLSSFKFSVSEYPNDFDFDLIREHGWYKTKNRGNNLGGVSRDHMYSVYDGFINKIDPNILAHPANCKLVIHSENVRKYTKSSISLEELLQRISEWDKRNII